jgi:hypothetical protein
MFIECFGGGVCVQVNLPPTPREELIHDPIGVPLCLIEEKNLVVAGVLYTSISACARFCEDDRLVNLFDQAPSYKAFLRRYLTGR